MSALDMNPWFQIIDTKLSSIFCLAVFILCGKIGAHFRGKERKGNEETAPRVGEEVI